MKLRAQTRGFTLIETMMAAALGAILVLACAAMFGAMDRTETATAHRFDETNSMARLHLVMDRVFSDLLILNADVPAAGSGTTGTAGRNTASSTSDFQQADAARNGQVQAQPRPRVSLDLDLSPRLKPAMQAAGMDAKGSPPQRLEVVTSHSPIPTTFSALSYASGQAQQLQQNQDTDVAMASRSAFELRPDAATPAARRDPGETPLGDGKGWTLWWRPLPPTPGLQTPDPYSMEPAEDPNSVRVAIGLVQCNWQAFKTVMDTATNKPKGREIVPTLTTSQLQDVPAYVEMLATTASGLSADWVFEVGWGYGPETTDEAQQLAAQGGGGAGGGGGGAQVTGRAGGPGGNPNGRGGRGGPGQGGTTVTGPDGRPMIIPGGGGRGQGGPGFGGPPVKSGGGRGPGG